MQLHSFWRWAIQELTLVSSTPYLDTELLLGYVLGLTRAQLHSQAPSLPLSLPQQESLKAYIGRRKRGEPIAYLLGLKEFWSLSLEVTSKVLIPRPETELLVQLLLAKYTNEKKLIADLGTGSGAIALALAIERPLWYIVATDYSQDALQVAKRNIQCHGIRNIELRQGDWCHTFLPNEQFDAIVSNPPYLAIDDSHFQSELGLAFEPKIALIAGENGLSHLKTVIASSRYYLRAGGYLFVEHGHDQAAPVTQFFLSNGYHSVKQHEDLAHHQRVSSGKWH